MYHTKSLHPFADPGGPCAWAFPVYTHPPDENSPRPSVRFGMTRCRPVVTRVLAAGVEDGSAVVRRGRVGLPPDAAACTRGQGS